MVRAMLAVGCLALVLRLGFVFLAYPLTPGAHPEDVRAPDGYTAIAENLLAGNGYTRDPALGPELQRPPGYPALNYLVYRIAGPSQKAMQFVNCLLGAITASLLTWLAWSMLGRAVGVAAGLVFSVHVLDIYYRTLLVRENLIILLLVVLAGSIWHGLARGRRRPVTGVLVPGLAGGLLALTNGMWLLLPGTLALAAVLPWPNARRRGLAYAALLVAVQAACIAPWTVRNHQVTGRFIPVSSSGGYTLWYGTCCMEELERDHGDFGSVERACQLRAREMIGRAPLNPGPEQDDIFLEAALANIRRSPGDWIGYGIGNLARIWYYNDNPRHQLPSLLAQLPFLALFLLGLALVPAGRRGAIAFLLVTPVYLLVLHAPFVPYVRYSVPMAPFLAVPAGVAVAAALRRLPLRRSAGGTAA